MAVFLLLRLEDKQLVEHHHGSHGLDDRDGTGQDTRVVSAFSLHGDRLSSNVNSLLVAQERRGRLESNAEIDVLSIADASLDDW